MITCRPPSLLPQAHLGHSWVIQTRFPAVHCSIALITVWQAAAEARKHRPSFSPANPFSKVTDPQLTAKLPATKLPPNERISLKCRACLSASLFLKGGEEAGHRGEKIQASFQQNSISTKQHFYPHKVPPWVNICTKLNVRSIHTCGTRVNVNIMVMSYL